MEFMTIAIAWYAIGLIGSAIMLEFFFRRDHVDITMLDALVALSMALLGPIYLTFLLIAIVFSWLKKVDRVIVKAKD